MKKERIMYDIWTQFLTEKTTFGGKNCKKSSSLLFHLSFYCTTMFFAPIHEILLLLLLLLVLALVLFLYLSALNNQLTKTLSILNSPSPFARENGKLLPKSMASGGFSPSSNISYFVHLECCAQANPFSTEYVFTFVTPASLNTCLAQFALEEELVNKTTKVSGFGFGNRNDRNQSSSPNNNAFGM